MGRKAGASARLKGVSVSCIPLCPWPCICLVLSVSDFVIRYAMPGHLSSLIDEHGARVGLGLARNGHSGRNDGAQSMQSNVA